LSSFRGFPDWLPACTHAVENFNKESNMRLRILCTTLFAAVLAAGVVTAQEKPTIKKVPLEQTSPVSGKEMFAAYCAACHGPNAQGDGPAAAALKKQPPDLTRLASNNGGKYPELQVIQTLSAREVQSHGSQEMPVWGVVLKSVSSRDNEIVRMRVQNLASYIKTLQK
jgi:mono/diheme cytochrome c family protein